MPNLSVFLIVVHLLVIPAYLLGLEHRTEVLSTNMATVSLPVDEVRHTSAFEGKPVEILS